MKAFLLLGFLASVASSTLACTITTASGPALLRQTFCANDLIFEDNFDSVDRRKWRPERTLAGGLNWEFQWYDNYTTNSYTDDGILHIVPTLTADIWGEAYLKGGTITIDEKECTESRDWGCSRTGTPDNILNPIRSARFSTIDTFAFKYGVVEFRVKLPAGDWIWPATWMMPLKSAYGDWPRSGEIDVMESRGNRNLYEGDINVGVQQAGSTMHFGPNFEHNAYLTAHNVRNRAEGWDDGFHTYRCEWTTSGIRFLYDGSEVLNVPVGTGFWDRGGALFQGQPNPWTGGTLMAPFDQEFYLIFNLAVGGTNGFFPDHFRNADAKPWLNTSGRAAADFWAGRDKWLQTWKEGATHMQVDYIRVWAV